MINPRTPCMPSMKAVILASMTIASLHFYGSGVTSGSGSRLSRKFTPLVSIRILNADMGSCRTFRRITARSNFIRRATRSPRRIEGDVFYSEIENDESRGLAASGLECDEESRDETSVLSGGIRAGGRRVK